MKLAFSSNAFRRSSLEEAIVSLAAIGYSGIEIMADRPHAYPGDLTLSDIGSISACLKRHGMEVSNVNAFTMHAVGDTYRPSWIEGDPSLRDERVAHTIRSIELARMLGARTVSTEPGGPLSGGADKEEALGLFREGLKRVEPYARRHGIKVLIEPEPGLMIENSAGFLGLARTLDPEVFGLNFDVGHFFCAGEDCALLIGDLYGHIHHFHIEDISDKREHAHLMPGEGSIDFERIFSAARRHGYGGFLTIELYTYESEPKRAATKAYEYLSPML